jgi:hypothetical protein
MNSQEEDVIFELYKLRSTVLPEKNTWSIEEIITHISNNSTLSKNELVDKLKVILDKLEEKQAVIFVNGYKAINLVEPKLLELVNISR